MFYKGLHIVESLSSRKRVQGYQVKRMVSDDYPLHLQAVFATEQEARAWVDNDFDPAQVMHRLTKEDKTILTLK